MNKRDFVQHIELIKGQLYKTAYLYVGSESKAMDIIDESVYKGYKALWQLREDTYFTTWMTRIVINECKKELKHSKRFIYQEVAEYTGTEMIDYDSLPLQEAVRALEEPFKEVIILRYFSGYTLAETAQLLNIPQGTVVTRQRRALALLKLELEEEDIR